MITTIIHNSKSIIMITTVYSIYCCKQLVYSSTRSLVNLKDLSTRLLVNSTTS